MNSQALLMKGPPAIDCAELHFKLVSKKKLISSSTEYDGYTSLITVANSCGLAFIGDNDGFFVVKTNSISENSLRQKRIQVERMVSVSQLAINCDETYLAVSGIGVDEIAVAVIYKCNSISAGDISEAYRISLTTHRSALICDIAWNPTVPLLLTACVSNGSIVMVEWKGSSVDNRSLPPASNSRCFCWSPKGKQLVVGSSDGKLTQYRPDLSAVKVLPSPNIFEGAACVINVLWISNSQFAAYYQHHHSEQFALVIVNADKNQPITYVNYEDITYSASGTDIHPQFHFKFLHAWNMILISSAIGVEVAVLHMEPGGNTWTQWTVGDSSRAEMPLSATQDDTYPLGMAIDLTNDVSLDWGESKLSPMPRLLLLSSEGYVCLYNFIFLRRDLPALCKLPSNPAPDTLFVSSVSPNNSGQSDANLVPVNASASAATGLFTLPNNKEHEMPATQLTGSVKQISNADFSKELNTTSMPKAEKNMDNTVNKLVEKSAEHHIESLNDNTKNDQPDNSVFDRAILDEINAINTDLRNLRVSLNANQVKPLVYPETSNSLVEQLRKLTTFEENVNVATLSQAEEINELKVDTLELVARVEDASVQLKKRHNSKLIGQLRQSEYLDPITSRSLKEILALRTYIESQIRLIGDHLDHHWWEYQQSVREKSKTKIATPFIDDVFKTIDMQKNLISHERKKVAQLQQAMDGPNFSFHRSAGLPSVAFDNVHSRSKILEFSQLADSFLGLNIKERGSLKPTEICEIMAEKRKEDAEACKLTASDLTLLFDRFEDAQVPQVSRMLNFSEREAHKKEISSRLKKASAAEELRKHKMLDAAIVSAAEVNPTVSLACSESSLMPKLRLSVSQATATVGSLQQSNIVGGALSFGIMPAELPLTKSEPSISTASTAFRTSSLSTDEFGNPNSGSSTATDKNPSAFTPFPSGGFSGFSSSSFGIAMNSANLSSVKPPTYSATNLNAFQCNVFGKPQSTTLKENQFINSTVAEAKTESRSLDIFSLKVTSAVSTPAATTTFVNFTHANSNAGTKQLAEKSATKDNAMKPLNSSIDIVAPKKLPSAESKSQKTVSSGSTESFNPGSKSLLKSETASNQSTTKTDFSGTGPTLSLKSEDSSAKSLAVVKTSPVSQFTTTTTTSLTTMTTKSTEASFSFVSLTTTTTSSSSLFGASTTKTSQITALPASDVVTATTATTPTHSTFSSAESLFSTTASPSLFSSITATTTATTSIFGASTSLFGSVPSSTSAFNTVASTPVPTPNNLTGLFNSVASSTTPSNIFGSPQTTTASFISTTVTTASSGLFSQSISPNTNVFGSSSQSSPSKFGEELNKTTSLFGQVLGETSAPSAVSQSNIFGQITPQKTSFDTGDSIFGNKTPTNSSVSIFGTPSPNSFGQKTSGVFASTTAPSTVFSQTSASSIFGASSFTAASPNQAVFGTESSTPAPFVSSFGAKPAVGQSIFGQNIASPQSMFGNVSSPQSSASIFGGSSGSAGGVLPANAFSTTTTVFNTAAPQSVFGSAPVFSKSTVGFGGAPVFGGSSSGSVFGSPSIFGSSQKVFGSSPGASFGQNQQPVAFDAIAGQNPIGFGTLAQQSQQSAFGSGFSSQNAFGSPQSPQQNQASFGGSSFSSWR